MTPWIAGIVLVACALFADVIVHWRKLEFDGKGRLGCIDGLRGILALNVFLYHYVVTYYFFVRGQWAVPPESFYCLLGDSGVGLFFMVTGFLFWNKILTSRGHVDWRKLYISRFFRLVPLYLFAVAFVVAIVFIAGGFKLYAPWWKVGKSILSWCLFWGSPDINDFPSTARIVAGVTWTLKYEWLFYFSLPVLAGMLVFSERRRYVLWALILVIMVVGAANYGTGVQTGFLLFFLAGALAAWAYGVKGAREIFQKKIFAVLGLGALLVLFSCFERCFFHVEAVVLLAVFFVPLALGNSYFGILKLRGLMLLGEISYGLYLLHGLLLYLVFSVGLKGFMTPAASFPQILLGAAGTGLALVAVCYTTFMLIEKPGIQYGRKIAKQLN